MKLGGVHHVSVNVHDSEETGRFYLEVLGMEQLPRPDFGFPGMWLRCGGQQIHLIQIDGHKAPEGQHFALRVDDIEAATEELSGKGIEVSPISQLPGGRQCFIHDPAGNLIELNQPGR